MPSLWLGCLLLSIKARCALALCLHRPYCLEERASNIWPVEDRRSVLTMTLLIHSSRIQCVLRRVRQSHAEQVGSPGILARRQGLFWSFTFVRTSARVRFVRARLPFWLDRTAYRTSEPRGPQAVSSKTWIFRELIAERLSSSIGQ